VNPDTDPISGQPELKHTPIALTPYAADWHGFVLHRGRLSPGAAWQAFIPLEDGVWRHEIAGQGPNPFAQLRAACAEPGATWIVLEDITHGLHRAAQLRDGRLLSVIVLGPDHALPPRDWLTSLFASPAIGSAARRSLLAGRPAEGPPPSPTICICHGISRATIAASITAGAQNPAAVGEATRAGTGCGSCRPEIAALCAALPVPEPA